MTVLALWVPGPQPATSYSGGRWVQPKFNPYRFHSPVPKHHGDRAVIEMLGNEKSPFVEGHDLRTVTLHVAVTGERWLLSAPPWSWERITRETTRQILHSKLPLPTRQAMNEGELKRRVLGRTRLDGWGVR